MQHTNLHSIYTDIFNDSGNLLFNNINRHRVDSGDTQCVLHCYRRDSGGGVTTTSGDSLDISLNTCATTGVTARYC